MQTTLQIGARIADRSVQPVLFTPIGYLSDGSDLKHGTARIIL